jgi:hypothetical protein
MPEEQARQMLGTLQDILTAVEVIGFDLECIAIDIERSSVDESEVREWMDREVRKLARLYLDGEMSSEEYMSRIDGLRVAASTRRKYPERKEVGLGTRD